MIATRWALITGSGKHRIGWHVANALAADGYGLVLHYRTSGAEANESVATFRSQGIDCEALAADLSREADVRELFRAIGERCGRLDVLVNCAGAWQSKRLEEVNAADVQYHFDVNVLATFLCAREAGLVMTAQPGGGCIVNLGDWAVTRPYPNYAAYFASKGSIETLTRCLAVELGTRNPKVRVNCVLPGPVMLPPDLPEAERRQAIAATLAQHEGRPENVAQAVLSLVQNEFITGASLTVDGGRSVWAGGL